MTLAGVLGTLVAPGVAGAVSYVNEGFDSVTQPALPVGFSAQTTLGSAGWATVGTLSFSPAGSVFVADPATATDARLTLPTIDVPIEAGGTGSASVSFLSRYEFDGQADGGVAEVSVAGGAFTGFDASDFSSGGYDGAIQFGTSNPLELRQAWTGSSGGSWRRVRIVLDRFAGQQVRVRLRMGSGSGGSAAGWWIDDVRVLVPPALGTPQTVVGSTWAVIDSPLDPRGRPGIRSIDHGLTQSYGSSSAAQGTGWDGLQLVPTLLIGLSPGSTHHYRGRLAFDDGETVLDVDRSIDTPAGAGGLTEAFEATAGSALPSGWANFAPFGGGGWVSAVGGRTGGRALFLPNQASLVDTSVILTTVAVPADATSAVLSFWQRYDFEDPYDAGSLEVSTDGAAFQAVSLADFDAGAPTKTIQSGNPLAGRRAWTGISPGGWENVRVDLSSSAGHTVTYRFRAGTDSFGAHPDGWRIDDLALTIVAPTPPPVDPPPPVSPPSGSTTPSTPGSATTPSGTSSPDAEPSAAPPIPNVAAPVVTPVAFRLGALRIEVPRSLDRVRLATRRTVRVRLLATRRTAVVLRAAGGVRRVVVRPGGWRVADVRLPATLGPGHTTISVTILANGTRRTVSVALR